MLKEISQIEESHLSRMKSTGEAFNLISIMKMENNERYTHSAIIAELLNPDGSHGYDNRFLKLFLETVGYSHFSPDVCLVSVEHYAGVQSTDDFSSRTFVDIVIRNNCNQEILIENKIWAGDQFKQLERTLQSATAADAKVIYLTPFGNEYTQNASVEYDRVSYQKHISEWLTKCILESSQTPIVSHSIMVYKNLVDKITNQNIYTKMNHDIKEEIVKTLQNFKTAQLIHSNYTEMMSYFPTKFWQSFEEKLGHKRNGEFNFLELKCRYEISENRRFGDTVFIHLKFEDGKGNAVLDNEEVNLFVESLRTEFHGDPQHCNNDWNIWFFADKGNALEKTFITDLHLDDQYEIITTGDFKGQISQAAQRFGQIISRIKSFVSEKGSVCNNAVS